jgi:hypothetical protein
VKPGPSTTGAVGDTGVRENQAAGTPAARRCGSDDK